MNTLNTKKTDLTISALAAHAFAHNIFNCLINDNLSPEDINLIHQFFTNLVTEHYRINIIQQNSLNKK